MTHVFILNPAAGKSDRIRKTLFELQVLSQQRPEKIHLYVTERKGHATELAQRAAATHEKVRIYACGGDGTINEVLQGVVGQKHVEMGCIPVGSGNDFVKNFDKDDFLNLEQQLIAPSVPVDTIYVTGEFGNRYSMNVVSLSWDSRVAIEVETFKKWPMIKGPVAYGLSVMTQMIKKETTVYSIDIDGETFSEKDYIIGMCANGSYYGGGFQGAPFAKLNDGLLEFVFIETITRRQLVRLFSQYQAGKHLTEKHPEFQPLMTYRQGKKVTLVSEKEIPITIDGEGFYSHKVTCEVAEASVNLILPGGSAWHMLI